MFLPTLSGRKIKRLLKKYVLKKCFIRVPLSRNYKNHGRISFCLAGNFFFSSYLQQVKERREGRRRRRNWLFCRINTWKFTQCFVRFKCQELPIWLPRCVSRLPVRPIASQEDKQNRPIRYQVTIGESSGFRKYGRFRNSTGTYLMHRLTFASSIRLKYGINRWTDNPSFLLFLFITNTFV